MKRSSMKLKHLVIATATAAVCLAPAPAQAHTLLSELLLKILLSDIVLAPPTAPGFQSHEAHFQPVIGGGLASGFQINQLEVPLAINSVIAAQLATIPLGSSSGGFSYTFDPAWHLLAREQHIWIRVRRARADSRAGALESRVQFPAGDVRHARRQESR
jgi:hypothetical protein